MAYSDPPSVSAGSTHTAAQWNTYVRANEIALAKPPLVWAYNPSTQAIANGVVTTMTLSATYVMRDFTLSSNSVTVPETGFYLVVTRLNWAVNATGLRAIRFLINGVSQVEQHDTPGAPTNWTQHGLTYGFLAASGDLLRTEVFQNSGGSLTLAAGGSMSVHMLSRQ